MSHYQKYTSNKQIRNNNWNHNHNNNRNNNRNHNNNNNNKKSVSETDIEDLLISLNKYSLTNKNIIDNVCIIEPPPRIKTETTDVNIAKRRNDYFYPPLECKDTLFWCWISHHYGLHEYEINKNNLYNYEINKKFEYVSCIRGNKLLLKSLKLNRTKLEESLLDNDGIGLGLFVFICLVHKYNVIYTDNYLYYQYIDEFNSNYIMINKRNNKYGLYVKETITKDHIESFKKNKWIVDSITKPLRSVGSYKVGEIKEICNIMNINIMKTETKSYTKNELYEKIKQHIM
jgi:hypothetical protein